MEKKEKKVYIGGQAVMEGVMMRAPDKQAIAVRRVDNHKIETYVTDITPPAKKHKFYGWPIVRGVVAFVNSLVMGMDTITRSAEMMGDDSVQEEPNKFEKWLSKVTGKNENDIMMFFAVVLAIILSVGLFFVLPSLAGSGLNKLLPGHVVLVNLIEGMIRIIIFLAYIIAVSQIKEIKRVFMYHGAEHKTVYCHEHEEELTVENCMKYPVMHPRCGTAFLFLVMIISILITSIASVFGLDNNVLTRVLVRLVLLPVIAGVSYELLQYLGKHENRCSKILRWPGMQLQRLTAKEPTEDMVEVAIVAMKLAAGIPWEPEQDEEEAEETEAAKVSEESPEVQEDTEDEEPKG